MALVAETGVVRDVFEISVTEVFEKQISLANRGYEQIGVSIVVDITK